MDPKCNLNVFVQRRQKALDTEKKKDKGKKHSQREKMYITGLEDEQRGHEPKNAALDSGKNKQTDYLVGPLEGVDLSVQSVSSVS